MLHVCVPPFSKHIFSALLDLELLQKSRMYLSYSVQLLLCISAPAAITHNHPQCQSARQYKVTARMVRKQQANIAYGGSALPLVVNEV